MSQFTYETLIKHLPPYGKHQPIETFKGTVSADSYDQAKTKVQSLTLARCKQLERERGSMYGYDSDNVKLQFVADEPATTMTASQMVALIRVRLGQARKGEMAAVVLYNQASGPEEEADAEFHLQFAGGQRFALECLLNEITGKEDAQ